MSRFDDRYLNYGDVYSIIMQAKTVDQAMNVLHLPYVEMPRWISVTERLPDEDVPVLVYIFGDSPYIAWINRDGEWQTEEFTIDRDYLPKAWMPLPEQYEELNGRSK